jgi:hypothetical protein
MKRMKRQATIVSVIGVGLEPQRRLAHADHTAATTITSIIVTTVIIERNRTWP